MSVAPSLLPNYTYTDYQHWEGRWEIIDGIPYAMSPMPIPRHQSLSADLIFLFKKATFKSCRSCKVYPPLDYKISENTIVQPDVLIVCKQIAKPYLDFPPELVVEILSPSTAKKDRNQKFEIYQAEAIPYYLIVDPNEEWIEVHQIDMTSSTYKLIEKARNFKFLFNLGDCKIEIDFGRIW